MWISIKKTIIIINEWKKLKALTKKKISKLNNLILLHNLVIFSIQLYHLLNRCDKADNCWVNNCCLIVKWAEWSSKLLSIWFERKLNAHIPFFFCYIRFDQQQTEEAHVCMFETSSSFDFELLLIYFFQLIYSTKFNLLLFYFIFSNTNNKIEEC